MPFLLRVLGGNTLVVKECATKVAKHSVMSYRYIKGFLCPCEHLRHHNVSSRQQSNACWMACWNAWCGTWHQGFHSQASAFSQRRLFSLDTIDTTVRTGSALPSIHLHAGALQVLSAAQLGVQTGHPKFEREVVRSKVQIEIQLVNITF